MKRPIEQLDLRALHAFTRLAQSRSFHETAKHLKVSTSALSQTIKSLEEQCDQPLFDRTTRPVSLTRFAEQILPAAQRLLDDARALQQRIHAFGRNAPRNIRLGCIDSFATTVGPSLIRGLDTHENNLQLYTGLAPDISRQLLERHVDFAVSTDPMTERESIHCVSLFNESWLAVYPPGHAPKTLHQRGDLHRAGLNMDFVRYSLRSRIGAQIERFIVHHGIKASRRFEFDATDTLLSLVAARMGWAISTPLCLLQSRHSIDAVEIVELSGAAVGVREFYLLWRDDTPDEQAQLLIRLIRQIISHSILPLIKEVLPQVSAAPIRLS